MQTNFFCVPILHGAAQQTQRTTKKALKNILIVNLCNSVASHIYSPSEKKKKHKNTPFLGLLEEQKESSISESDVYHISSSIGDPFFYRQYFRRISCVLFAFKRIIFLGHKKISTEYK